MRRIRTMLGRVIRDIARKIAGRPELAAVFAPPLSRARRVKDQRRCERGHYYSTACTRPKVECTRLREARFGGRREVGKGKARKPCEFGVKVSVATPLNRCQGGQFVVHVTALPGRPYDGHKLATIIPEIETNLGAELARIITDAGYCGHTAPKEKRFKVYVAGQKRRLSAAIKHALKRRAAVEPVVGHLKTELRMGRNHRTGRNGDAANAVLAAVGYNLVLLLSCLELLLRLILIRLAIMLTSRQAVIRA